MTNNNEQDEFSEWVKEYFKNDDINDVVGMIISKHNAFKNKQEAKPIQLDEAKIRDSIADKIHEVLHGWFWDKHQKRVDTDVLGEDIYSAIVPHLKHNLSLKSLMQKSTAPSSLIAELRVELSKVNKKDYPEAWVDGYERAIGDVEAICKT